MGSKRFRLSVIEQLMFFCEKDSEAAAKIAGVGKVHLADDAAYEHQLAENIAPLVAALMEMRLKRALPAIYAGVLIAGLLVTLALTGVKALRFLA